MLEEWLMSSSTPDETQTPTSAPGARLVGGHVQIDPGLDLLLLTCPPWGLRLPPLHLPYLAAACRARGFSVGVLDLNIWFYHRLKGVIGEGPWGMMSAYGKSPRELARKMIDASSGLMQELINAVAVARPAFIGFSLQPRNQELTDHLVRLLKHRCPEPRVVYGGPVITSNFWPHGLAETLAADAYVFGEGEQTLAELLEAHREGDHERQIPGLLYARRPTPDAFVPRPVLRDLDQLPDPSFEDFDLRLYQAGRLEVPFILSRGCVCNCSYCEDKQLLGRFRVRSPERAVAEIRSHVERQDVRFFHFNDLLCNGNLKKLERFCEALAEAKLGIEWCSYAIVRRGMTDEIYHKLYASGCRHLFFGVESGSDRVLKLMNKHYTAEVAAQNLRDCAEAGIEAHVNIIVGFPGEGEEEHLETLEFIQDNARWISSFPNVGGMSVSPGSKIERQPDAFGIEIDETGEWTREDDGNSPEIRRLRVQEVLQLAHELDKKVGTINMDGVVHPEKLSLPVEAHLSIRSLEMRAEPQPAVPPEDLELDPTLRYDPMQAACVEMVIDAATPIPVALIRLQIFCEEASGDRFFVFGTNTDRFDVTPRPLRQGSHLVSLHFDRLNLPPGRYWITAGVWPGERVEPALDARHSAFSFVIEGTPEDPPQVALLNSSWMINGGPLQGTTEPDHLALRWRDEDLEDDPVVAGTHDELSLGFLVDKASDTPLELQAVIFDAGGRRVHHTTSPEPLMRGTHAGIIRFQPLGLLEGRYRLRLALREAGQPQPREQVECSLVVRCMRQDGAGIVHLPVRWSFSTP
jgi:radical SAM superfamily enzyme YgiQ (UPF0313 family)